MHKWLERKLFQEDSTKEQIPSTRWWAFHRGLDTLAENSANRRRRRGGLEELWLFVCLCPSAKTPTFTRVGWFSSMCNRFPTLICILSYTPVQHYPPLQQLHSDFGGFNNGVWHIMKITIARNNTDMGLWTQTFCLSPDFQARANETSMMTMSVASDQGQEELW